MTAADRLKAQRERDRLRTKLAITEHLLCVAQDRLESLACRFAETRRVLMMIRDASLRSRIGRKWRVLAKQALDDSA